MEESKIKEAIASLLEIDSDLLESNKLDLIEEVLSISNSNAKTDPGNRDSNFDRMWKDIRSIFGLLDKTGLGVAKNVEILNTMKVTLVAVAIEIRRQVKNNQKDLASLKKTVEKDVKEIKETQKETLKEIKDFKKMVDLYMNPPAQMAPLSRKTLKPYKGVGKE